MFYRYISEHITSEINRNQIEVGDINFNYATLTDDEAERNIKNYMIKGIGYFILPSELFSNIYEKAKKKETWKNKDGTEMLLNEKLESIFRHIEGSARGHESEQHFKGLFDDFDVNSNKLGPTVNKRNETLFKLLNGINNMDLGPVTEHENDTFGDSYEFLMGMYASNAGKSGGEYFTPADVSVLLTRLGTVGKKSVNKVYDPACGSGSLLLKAKQVLGKNGVTNGYYGQEKNVTTYNLCRINMFLHGVGFENFDIKCEDTLLNPQHDEKMPFELIVSNPPYSIKWEGGDNSLLINDPRYEPAGVLAPKSKADFAFIMHSLYYLAPNGAAAIVCFPGIFYRAGAEQKIRKYLVDNNFIDCIIALPSNLFFGTNIATCIMIMKKNKIDNKILFIDASEQYVKVTNNNKLQPENIDNIVNAYAKREDKGYFCKLVENEVIGRENNYNLSVSTYVEQKDIKEKIDIKQLNAEIEEIVKKEQILRDEINKIIAMLEGENF